jgi:transcriptional regulator with XRE-family HTH domain
MTPADLNKRLGAVIREKRVMLGLSQEALGKRIGVTFQQVQKYEKGVNQVVFARLVELAEALDTSVTDLATVAVGEQPVSREGISDRQTLELMKRFERLTPNQRRGVQLLVHNLVEAA